MRNDITKSYDINDNFFPPRKSLRLRI